MMSTKLLAPNVTLERLEAQLQSRLGNRLREICIERTPEGLILHGRCAKYHTKQLAQHTVMELTEIPIFANEIDVV